MGRSQKEGTPWHYEYLQTDKKGKNSNTTHNTYAHKANKQNYNPKITVELGNIVIVESAATREWIDIHVTDTKNPFYKKKINDVVLIRGEKYKIVKVKKRQ